MTEEEERFELDAMLMAAQMVIDLLTNGRAALYTDDQRMADRVMEIVAEECPDLCTSRKFDIQKDGIESLPKGLQEPVRKAQEEFAMEKALRDLSDNALLN